MNNITLGYKVQERGEVTAQLTNEKYGSAISHILIILFTVWWTFGVANVLWLVYNYYTKSDKVLVKLIQE